MQFLIAMIFSLLTLTVSISRANTLTEDESSESDVESKIETTIRKIDQNSERNPAIVIQYIKGMRQEIWDRLGYSITCHASLLPDEIVDCYEGVKSFYIAATDGQIPLNDELFPIEEILVWKSNYDQNTKFIEGIPFSSRLYGNYRNSSAEWSQLLNRELNGIPRALFFARQRRLYELSDYFSKKWGITVEFSPALSESEREQGGFALENLQRYLEITHAEPDDLPFKILVIGEKSGRLNRTVSGLGYSDGIERVLSGIFDRSFDHNLDQFIRRGTSAYLASILNETSRIVGITVRCNGGNCMSGLAELRTAFIDRGHKATPFESIYIDQFVSFMGDQQRLITLDSRLKAQAMADFIFK